MFVLSFEKLNQSVLSDLLNKLLDSLTMHVPSPDPLLELLEGFTCACVNCRFSISTTILLHRPSVIVAEVKKVPEFGVVARGLEDVTIIDLRMSKHRSDHVF